MSTAEFDAFGPWVDEVRTADDVPRLFRGFPLDLDSCRLVLKVPRNIARRDATPDLDLYDQLLIVGPRRLTVLDRRDDSFGERSVGFDEITAIVDSVNFVDGRLTVYTSTEPPVSVRYNGSSQPVLRALVSLLREVSLGPTDDVPRDPGDARDPGEKRSSAAGPTTPDLAELRELDLALVADSRELLRTQPELRLLAGHARGVVVPRGGALARALHAAYPMTLQGVIVSGSARELQVLSRRDWWVRGSRPVHSIARTVFPLARLEAATAAEHARYRGVTVVTMRAGAMALDLPVPSGSDAEAVLLAARPPSQGPRDQVLSPSVGGPI